MLGYTPSTIFCIPPSEPSETTETDTQIQCSYMRERENEKVKSKMDELGSKGKGRVSSYPRQLALVALRKEMKVNKTRK